MNRKYKLRHLANLQQSEIGFDSAADGLSLNDIVTVTLENADITTLKTAPTVLIPAPGAGKVNIVKRIVASGTGSVAAYTGTNPIEFKYKADGSGAKVSADLPTTIINAADGVTVLGTVAGIEAPLVPLANEPIVAYVAAADPVDPGTAVGTVTIVIEYTVIDFD